MALLQEQPTYPVKRLLLTGVPAFLVAVAISLVTHWWAHRYADNAFCESAQAESIGPTTWLIDGDPPPGRCAMSGLLGGAWTLGLAVASFALLVRFPKNLFLFSLAFVNASARIPESVTVFLQYLINRHTSLRVDESLALTLMGPIDPAVPSLIMCLYTLLLIFFTVIVVHNVKVVRHKWPIALALFAAMTFIVRAVLYLIDPVIRG